MLSPANTEYHLLLASASPRRKALLASFGLAFDIVNADVDESVLANESPLNYVQRVALLKATSTASQHKGSYIIAADTTVVLGDRILGKPTDTHDAKAMLRDLSDRQHSVISSVVLLNPLGVKTQQTVTTKVRFASLSEDDIATYCATKEPFDKAGSYAIQGYGGRFVRSIEGSYSAVVGLPLYELSELLRQAGFEAGYGVLS